MGLEEQVEAARSALIKKMGRRSYLRPAGLIESLTELTGNAPLTIRQALCRLVKEKWLEGVSPDGIPFAQVKIIGEIPPEPANPDLERWLLVLQRSSLAESDKEALAPLYSKLACFETPIQEKILVGLVQLRENLDQETGCHRFIVSARYLIGSSKLLDELPSTALRTFGIQIDRFPSHPHYVVVAGCAKPEAVVLIENPAAFEMAVATRAVNHCAFIATFGFGLSKSQEDYGNQLANMVEGHFSGAITLTREGSSCQTAEELLNHHNITFWGDLDVAGIQIFQRLKKTIPGLRLSALYRPMLAAAEDLGLSHPYVLAVGKSGQSQLSPSVTEGDALTREILFMCALRGVDQECVLPEQVEQFAAYELMQAR